MALVHPGGLTYTMILIREIPRKGGTAGLGPSPSWVPIETDEDEESGNSVSGKLTKPRRAHLGTAPTKNVDRAAPRPILNLTMLLCLLAQAQ